MTFSIVIMVGRGYFLPTHVHEASKNEKSFSIGNDLFDANQEYLLSYNAIIPSHIGVFGNTGSGKSNTLAKLLHEYSKILIGKKNAHLLLIDINNEYGENAICNYENKTVYSLTTRKDSDIKIPIDYNDLTEDEWCLLLNATEATQRPVIKTAANDSRSPEQYREIIISMIKSGQHSLIKAMQYNLKEYMPQSLFLWDLGFRTTSARLKSKSLRKK